MKPLAAVLLLLSASSLHAQPSVDPAGHWEGLIQAPGLELRVEIDLAKSAAGDLKATLTVPAQNIEALPLKLSVDGRSISLHARADQPIAGVLSDDGQSIAANFSVGGHSLPFTLTRTGDARIYPRGKSAAIGAELEGTWHASVEGEGVPARFVLTLANQADGSGAGTMVSVDEGGLEVPASAVTQVGSQVVIDFKAVGAAFAGSLTPEGTELPGTYTRGALAVPVTFRRASGGKQEP